MKEKKSDVYIKAVSLQQIKERKKKGKKKKTYIHAHAAPFVKLTPSKKSPVLITNWFASISIYRIFPLPLQVPCYV